MVRDTFEDVKDFLLVDVTGEVTGIAVIRDSALEDTLSFPYGRNTIVRYVVKKTKSVPEDVLARIKIASSDDQSDINADMKTDENTDVKEAIFEEEKQWTDMFGKACSELSSETNPLPRKVFLVSDTNSSDWFHKMIERVDFSQFTVTREAFLVDSIIGNKLEESIMQVQGTVKLDSGVIQDNFLIMDSVFYNREYLSRRN